MKTDPNTSTTDPEVPPAESQHTPTKAERIEELMLVGHRLSGQWRRLERYCLEDVRITQDLYEFAKRRGFLWYVPRGKWRRVRFGVTL